MEIVSPHLTSRQKRFLNRFVVMISVSVLLHLIILAIILFGPHWGGKKPVMKPKYNVSLVSMPENLMKQLPAAPVVEEKKAEPPKPVKKDKPKKAIPVAKKKDDKKKPVEQTQVPPPITPASEDTEEVTDDTTFNMDDSGKGVTRSGAMVVDGGNFPFIYYLQIVRDKISRNWFPPLGVIIPGDTKSMVIYFKISKNGDVFSAEIEEGSGNSLLDQSALRSVLVSNPFPPLPFGYTDEDLGIHFRFICFR